MVKGSPSGSSCLGDTGRTQENSRQNHSIVRGIRMGKGLPSGSSCLGDTGHTRDGREVTQR